MPALRYSTEETVRLGQERYEREIRDRVEPQHNGKYLALDIEAGEYEIDTEDIEAIRRVRARRPDAPLYILRIGYAAAYRLRAMKKKAFDCVRMKWQIQRQQREQLAGLPETEQRRILTERVAADPILGPFLQRARYVSQSRLPH